MEIIRSHRDDRKKAKESMTPTERKITTMIRETIKKMKSEDTGGLENIQRLSRKYSTQSLPIDDLGWMRVLVVLPPHATLSDTLTVTEAIVSNNGTINYVFNPGGHFQIEIDCSISFDCIETIAGLPTVGIITTLPIDVH